jgi:hypothetical protein
MDDHCCCMQVFGSIRKTVNGTVLKSAPEFNGEGATFVINKYFIVPPGQSMDFRAGFHGCQAGCLTALSALCT